VHRHAGCALYVPASDHGGHSVQWQQGMKPS